MRLAAGPSIRGAARCPQQPVLPQPRPGAARRLGPCSSGRVLPRRRQCTPPAASAAPPAEAPDEQEEQEPSPWPSLLRRSRSRYVNRLNARHGIADFVEFYQSVQGLPVAYLLHPSGHTLEVQLQGATITRWLTEEGRDLLHVRSDAVYETGEAINSGIPIAFPQWRDGPLPFNGFAGNLQWEVAGAALDGEFVNHMISGADWAAGRVRLAIDPDAGTSRAPRPEGVLDADARGQGAGEAAQDMAAGIDALYDAADAQPATAAKKRKGKAAKEAEAAAAAAAATAAAAAEAGGDGGQGGDGGSSDEADEAEGAAGAAAAAPAAAAGGAPAAAGADADDDGEEGGEWELNYGLLEDPAPCLILRLRDSPETRAIWPHRFELLYKITLSEDDSFPDPKEGFPTGIMPWTGGAAPLSAEEQALVDALAGDDEELAAAAAAVLAEHESGPITYEQPQPGVLSGVNGYRMFSDVDGHIIDDDEAVEEPPPARGFGGAASSSSSAAAGGAAPEADGEPEAGKKSAGRRKQDTAGAGSSGEDEVDYELPRELYDSPEPVMQVKMQLLLKNKDKEGSAPMAFQLAALSHFATKDQMRHGAFVRVLGLGGVQTFDWSADARKPRLSAQLTDYLTFDGEAHEAVFIGSADAAVKFCPGSRTHFELLARKGMTDHVVWHPGARGVPGLEAEPRVFAQVGAGRIALPKKLAPGETWSGEYVIRHHPRYWDPPIFDRDSAQPMAQLNPQRDDADDLEGDDRDIEEGLQGSMLGGGAHVPLNDV